MSLKRMGLLPALLLLVSSGSPATMEQSDGSSPGDITPGPISGMNFAYIPSGSFVMGTPTSDPDPYHYEWPVHTVTFSYSFEMMTTEVTQGMWEEVMGSNPSCFYGLSRPLEEVAWFECPHFVDAMNALDPAHEYRLPSESEWEYCCRAGTTTLFYWGDDPSFTLIDSYAWYGDNSGGETHPVGQKLPNAWGLYDMNGNVWEWCQDYWHDSYTGAPSDGSAWESSYQSGSGRVLRGGSWDNDAWVFRSTYRGWYDDGRSGFNHLGFRLARSAR
jgi:formylglycine-generating enzyme required for sulfatase activity